MKILSLDYVTVIISFIGIIIQIIGAIKQLLEILREIWPCWKKFFFGFLIILFTLIIPEIILLCLLLPIIVQLVTSATWDQHIVKMSISIASASIGSIYPFLWMIFVSRKRIKKLKNQIQISAQTKGENT